MAKLNRKAVVKQAPDFKDVKAWYEKHLHPDVNDYDDPHVYEYVYKEGNFAGIFQLTSHGAQRLFKQAQPQSIVDIAMLTAIYRPGPLAAGVDKIYLKARHDNEKLDWGHPLFEKVLGKTYNCLIFQESVTDLAEFVAGFPKDQCDNVRKAIIKRDQSKGEAAVKASLELEDSFVAGAVKNGIPEAVARKSYQQVLWMAGYAFNRCLHVDELVNTYHKNGNFKTKKRLCDVKAGDVVMSRDEKTKQNILVKVLAQHKQRRQELVEIELMSGEKIKCTLDHKFRTVETGEMLPLQQIMNRNLSIVVSSLKQS